MSHRVPRRLIAGAGMIPGIEIPSVKKSRVIAAELLKIRVLAAFAAVLLVAACSQGGARVPRDGGMTENESADVSIAVAQIRAKLPRISASQPAYEPRLSDALPLEERVQLALRGQGSSVAPGALSGKTERVSLEFYVDKRTYQDGYAEIAIDDEEARRWRIVAYEHRGAADGEFDFVYLMSDPDGALAYMVILGRDWAETGGMRRSYEATIIRPGKGARVDRWREAYYFDLGLDHRIVPVFQNQIEVADTTADRIGRNLKKLASLKRKHGNLEKRLNELLDRQPAQPSTDSKAKRVMEMEGKLGEMQAQWEAGIRGAEQDALTYYTLRGGIAEAFARFLDSNYYHWQRPRVQQRYFDDWAEIEDISNTMKEHLAGLLPNLSDTGRIERARELAADRVAKHGNAGKRPPRD